MTVSPFDKNKKGVQLLNFCYQKEGLNAFVQ
jgi:hypothetical protein